MKIPNLGIIGLGDRGRIHLNNCLRLKNTKLCGVADTSKSALKYAKGVGVKKCYENYEDLLKEQEIDAVVISLPNFLHLESVLKASEAGKSILLEKPLARNIKEGKTIVSSVQKNDVRLMIGFDLRFRPSLKKLREEIHGGLYGEVELAQATSIGNGPFSERRGIYGPTPVPEWWFNKTQVGGGALLDLGCHLIDLLTWYFGEVEKVESHLEHVLEMEVEDLAICRLKFRNGPLAVVNVGWFSKTRLSSLSIHGTARNFATNLSIEGIKAIIWNDIKRKLGWTRDNADYQELSYFVDCLSKDKKPHPSEMEGLANLEILNLAYQNKD